VKRNQFTPTAVARPAGQEFAIPVVWTVPPTHPTRVLSEQGPHRKRMHEGVTRSADMCAEVFIASWCRSVGTTWTVELRSVDCGAQDRPVEDRPVEWIPSGVPTQQPAPERQTADLLHERGLLLFPVDPADPAESPPRTRSRQLIGYVTRDPELMRLALTLTHVLDAGGDHPMIVAAWWMRHGRPTSKRPRSVAGGSALSGEGGTATMER
jgi:hypothetical protein